MAFRAGPSNAAEPLYELLLPHARAIIYNGASVWGPVTRHLGRLALMMERYDVAETHLAAATSEHERLGAPIWQADTDRLRGVVQLRRPGRDPADRDSRRPALLYGVTDGRTADQD